MVLQFHYKSASCCDETRKDLSSSSVLYYGSLHPPCCIIISFWCYLPIVLTLPLWPNPKPAPTHTTTIKLITLTAEKWTSNERWRL